MDPLKPEKGQKYTGPDTGKIYEWDGDKWVVFGENARPRQEEEG